MPSLRRCLRKRPICWSSRVISRKYPALGGSLILVEGRGVLHSLRDFGMGAVGGREPGNGEHGLVSVLVFAQELKGCIHRDHGARSLDLQVLSIAAEIGIVVEEVQPRKPLVESGPAGEVGLFGWTDPMCHLPKCPVT